MMTANEMMAESVAIQRRIINGDVPKGSIPDQVARAQSLNLQAIELYRAEDRATERAVLIDEMEHNR
jgi:hypothetical protein